MMASEMAIYKFIMQEKVLKILGYHASILSRTKLPCSLDLCGVSEPFSTWSAAICLFIMDNFIF